jgi:cytochrome c2
MGDTSGGQGKPNAGSTAPGAPATSPLRWLLVVVPLLVIAAAATNLAGLWLLPGQQSASNAPSSKVAIDPRRGDNGGTARNLEPTPQFDAGAVVSLLARANVEGGERQFRMCTACHPAEKGAPHRVGSNLWNIIGQRKAALPQFNYSAALRAKGGTWSYQDLAEYLNNPRKFAPSTSMAFVGITDPERLANLIAYLRTLSDNPVPLPR